jgi:16S rRNA (cytosine967-C5)-methyltransferase
MIAVPVSRSRQIAFDTLLRVERRGAFSTDLLHGLQPLVTPARAANEERDLALATEIVLGCLRRQGEIDHLLAEAGRRPTERFDLEVLIAARIGCYQLRFLERIPPHAAVSQSVELVKRARKKSAAGFINALLRNLPPRPAEDEGLLLSHPSWLVGRWQRNYGSQTTQAILKANLATPATYLRINPEFDCDETVQLLAAEGVPTEATELPLARRVLAGRPAATRCFTEGRCRIQELGSQYIVPLLELTAAETFLDLCAAPGGKTLQAIELRGTSGGVVAADLHPHRLRTLKTLSYMPIDCVALDGRDSLPFQRPFDRILVDAPCSGTGTLARNPEIKWRITPADLDDLAARQKALLNRALGQLAVGGRLVYSTCSLEPEENQQVVEEVLRGRTDLAAGAYLQRVPGRAAGDGFFACAIHKLFQAAPRGMGE